MRTKGLWTIHNKYQDKTFYGLYDLGDTAYVGTKAGFEGWLDPNQAKDLKVDFKQCQVVFWKDQPFVGLGDKLAAPANVTTDRPLTLTASKEVSQPAEADALDPDITDPTVFLTDIEINNIGRTIAIGIVEKFPEVGEALAAIIGFLWSEQKEDIPELINKSEQRMKRWVQGRIQDYDREFLENTLSGLRKNLKEYEHANGPKERHTWYNICLAACERAMPHYVKKNYTPGTIDMVTAVATIHLTLLRERVLFPDAIYGDEPVNHEFHKQNLKDTIDEYQKFILDTAIDGELEWRLGRITDDKEIESHHYLTDLVTREIHEFLITGRNHLSQGDQQVCVDYYRAQAKNAYAIQLHENISHTARFWSLLDPDQKDTHPIPLNELNCWVGPLAGLSYMVGNEHGFQFNDCVHEPQGRITAITLRVGQLIDGIKFHFDDQRNSDYVGGDGGAEHTVAVPDGHYLTRVDTWFDFDLWAIQFHFSDGSASTVFGTPSRGGVKQFAEFPDHHITQVRIGTRLHEMSFGFTPLPDYYERLEPRSDTL